jgi:hypothetical protein
LVLSLLSNLLSAPGCCQGVLFLIHDPKQTEVGARFLARASSSRFRIQVSIPVPDWILPLVLTFNSQRPDFVFAAQISNIKRAPLGFVSRRVWAPVSSAWFLCAPVSSCCLLVFPPRSFSPVLRFLLGFGQALSPVFSLPTGIRSPCESSVSCQIWHHSDPYFHAAHFCSSSASL